jgi:hypothetical protein
LGWRSAAVRIGVSDTGVRKLAGEDRRIFSPIKKSLNKCIDVGSCEGVPLGSRMAPNLCKWLLNFTGNYALRDRPEGHWHGFEELGRPLGKIGVIEPARRH